MKTIEINGAPCAINADGAYVPVANIKEIDKLRDELVERLCAKALEFSQLIANFRASSQSEVEEFRQVSAQDHGIRMGGKRGGFALTSFDGALKIIIDNDTLVGVNEKVSIAREAIFSCVKRWSQGANANLAELVRHAFETDKQGHLSVARLLALRSYKIENDDEWTAAMEALAEGMTATGSKTYMRFYQRNAEGEYKQIPLG